MEKQVYRINQGSASTRRNSQGSTRKSPSRKRRHSRKSRRIRDLRIRVIAIAAVVLLVLVIIIVRIVANNKPTHLVIEERPELVVDILDYNEYSRPGIALEEINGIVIHYTANPGTTAEQNRDYFQSLSETGETYASSHFIIGQDGTIVQCIPTSEISYASNDRNWDTLSIECCYNNEDGSFEQATYDQLIYLVAWLCTEHDLDPATDVIRHYDVTGKECPLYYVENPDAWERLKQDVADYIEANAVKVEVEEE